MIIDERAGTAYTTSKHAIIGLTKSTAAFYAKKGIRCVCIMPGAMPTNIGGADLQKRAHQEGMGQAFSTMAMQTPMCDLGEVTNVVLSMCSDGMGVANGACFSVDNGWTAY